VSGEPLAPPPSFGRQLAQLVVIPALIVIACIAVAALFGKLAGAEADIHSHLARLKQDGGAGKMAFDLQDPRYKDRWLAAYNVATLIPGIKDPAERKAVSDALIQILQQHVTENEDLLQGYLLTAMGQLGQEGGLPIIVQKLQVPQDRIAEGAICGLLSWPDAQAARVALPQLAQCLSRQETVVAAQAAAALGALATSDDQAAIAALQQSLETPGSGRREVQWNSAVALARLGDARGSRLVAGLLLNRAELAKLPADAGAPGATLSPALQDRVILSTLGAAGNMTDPEIWVRIEALAQDDPNPALRSAAKQLLMQRTQPGR
jgi:hypothetical protein